MSNPSTKSQKSSKSSTTSTATKAFVQQSVKLLNDTQSQLATLPNSILVVDKRKVAKFRKGAEGIIPKIGTLIQNAGLDGGPLAVDDMLANPEQGQTLAPLLRQLESVTVPTGHISRGIACAQDRERRLARSDVRVRPTSAGICMSRRT